MITLLVIFALWRVCSVVAAERGLFKVGVFVRTLCGLVHDPNGELIRMNGGAVRRHSNNPLVDAYFEEMSRGVTCMWCNSLWFSPLGVYALYVMGALPTAANGSQWVVCMVAWLALSTAVIVLERTVKAIADLPDALKQRQSYAIAQGGNLPPEILDKLNKATQTKRIKANGSN